MEAIGKSGAVGEKKQVKNGGDSLTNCTRTAIYDRLGGALFGHDGWFGYYRPKKLYQKIIENEKRNIINRINCLFIH